MSGNGQHPPSGYHSVTPHLKVRGAAKAIEFYQRAFGAQEVCRMPGPDGASVMHAEVRIGNSPVMLCDEYPQWGCLSPLALGNTPVTMHLYVPDVDAAVQRAVDAGAKVTMPVADMFWGDRYGKVTDPFGHEWSLATRKEDLTPEQMAERGKAAM